MRLEVLAALCLVPLLAGCGASAGGGKVPSAGSPRPSTGVRAPVRRPVPPTAQVQNLPGLEGVIGSTAADLNRQFGAARLDVWEGDGRKLQYSGAPCILDVYLYPSAEGREPQATYVDARRTDGRDVDRAACIAALRKR
jgi:hypothetical protein